MPTTLLHQEGLFFICSYKMQCYGCRNKIDNAVYTCCETECKKTFCTFCANVGQTNTDLTTWVCPACRSSERKTGYNSSGTPVRPSNPSENVTMRKKTLSSKPSTPVTSATSAPRPAVSTAASTSMTSVALTPRTAAPSTASTLTLKPSTTVTTPSLQPPVVSTVLIPNPSEVSELTSVIRTLTQEITTLKDKLETATSSLTLCHQRLDELVVHTAVADKRLQNLEDSQSEVKALKATVGQLELELRSHAQNQVRNEVEIVGIPEHTNENLMHVVLTAAVKIGIDVKEEDIDWVVRSGPKPLRKVDDSRSNLSRPIVFRFVRRIKRDSFIKAARPRKNIIASDLLQTAPDHKIYINERLTRENRLLFREARAKAKDHGFLYCWTSQGNIYVRQRQGKPAMAIKTQEDIFRIFRVESNQATVM